jgi:hypothetical protein
MEMIIVENDGFLYDENHVIIISFMKNDKIYKKDNLSVFYGTEDEALKNGLTHGV